MDLQSLAALLTGIGGYFSAKAGATAGQLQGLLMGEELTERRKRMKMAEEAHQMQMELMQQEKEQRAEMFPVQKEILTTQAETGKLNLHNQRLWSLYMQGVPPSKVSDPVLRQEYEQFFNYMSVLKSLEAVQTEEDLNRLLQQADEAHRPTLELLGRGQLYKNQMWRETVQRQLKGLDINLATGEFQLRTAQLNTAYNIVLSNIDKEGVNWDKRPPEQKIEAVQKWLKEAGLEQAVPPTFAYMFQRVQSSDARQLFILRAQADYLFKVNSGLLQQQIWGNLTAQRELFLSNLLFGAFQQQPQQGYLGVPPVGIPALPTLNIFNSAYDKNGSLLNSVGLREYLKFPVDVYVPVNWGNQRGYQSLNVLATQVSGIYKRLSLVSPTITADDINTLVSFDAGLHLSYGKEKGVFN
jgi:hypothetical protein